MPNLSSPSSQARPSLWADWLELRAFCDPSYSCQTQAVSTTLDFDQDHESETIDGDDARHECRLAEIIEELHFRKRVMGPSYPYDVKTNGRVVTLRRRWTESQSTYLFCLMLSHATGSPILPKGLRPPISQKERRLFQTCATVCAADYMTGPSVYFDYPRPDGSSIREKLTQVVNLWGEGRVRARPLAGMSGREKDSGIDVIAWRLNVDQLPSFRLLLGQTASGITDWSDKSIIPYIENFLECWFEERPGTTPIPALFTPFCVEPPQENHERYSPEEVLRGHMLQLNRRFGVFFYRYRVAAHVGRALELAKQGISPIEERHRLRDVRSWVRSCRKRLLRLVTES